MPALDHRLIRLKALPDGFKTEVAGSSVAFDPPGIVNKRGRELGSELEHELVGSVRKARLLDQQAPAETVRVVTDGRPVVDIAREVVAATGWTGPDSARRS